MYLCNKLLVPLHYYGPWFDCDHSLKNVLVKMYSLIKINQRLKWLRLHLTLHHPMCTGKHCELPTMGKLNTKTKGTSLVALQNHALCHILQTPTKRTNHDPAYFKRRLLVSHQHLLQSWQGQDLVNETRGRWRGSAQAHKSQLDITL